MRMQKKSEIFFNVWLNFAFIDEINTANEKSALTKLSDSRLAAVCILIDCPKPKWILYERTQPHHYYFPVLYCRHDCHWFIGLSRDSKFLGLHFRWSSSWQFCHRTFCRRIRYEWLVADGLARCHLSFRFV